MSKAGSPDQGALKVRAEGLRVAVVTSSWNAEVCEQLHERAVATLREAGAAEVHIRISSPPVAWPCFFGIDFPTRAELIASSMSVELAEMMRLAASETEAWRDTSFWWSSATWLSARSSDSARAA